MRNLNEIMRIPRICFHLKYFAKICVYSFLTAIICALWTELSKTRIEKDVIQAISQETFRTDKSITADKDHHSFMSIKILCWVMTTPKNHDTKAMAIKNTWGKRCDKIIFMSSMANSSLPSIDLGSGEESRKKLWIKYKRALKYCYDNYMDQFDWFLRTDDDTYVVMENLKYFLSSYDGQKDAIVFGSRFKKFTPQGYMSGGGVLSRKALKIMVEQGFNNSSKCKSENYTGSADVEMGRCLNNVKVLAGDSRDAEGRGRFFPFQPIGHLNKLKPKHWYFDYIYYPIKNGLGCCSDIAIYFHYASPKKMYELDYLIYQLHPIGVKYNDPFPPLLAPDKKSIPERVLKLHGLLKETK